MVARLFFPPVDSIYSNCYNWFIVNTKGEVVIFTCAYTHTDAHTQTHTDTRTFLLLCRGTGVHLVIFAVFRCNRRASVLAPTASSRPPAPSPLSQPLTFTLGLLRRRRRRHPVALRTLTLDLRGAGVLLGRLRRRLLLLVLLLLLGGVSSLAFLLLLVRTSASP